MTDLGSAMDDPAAVMMDPDHGYSLCLDQQGREVGIFEYHRTAAGNWCSGYVEFKGMGNGKPEWTVVLRDPLTLTPSILCRACGAHGYIEGGCWRSV